ncbi:MAG: PaaI family thioesterase [Lachnospiraceae bacterium]|jgi:acyl-coenzyme A thioesterase PaaI-like protein
MVHDELYEKFCARTVKDHKVLCSRPWRETCYGCRDRSDGGLHVRVYFTDDGYAAGIARTDASENGFPNVTHGGILATYFDEVCWHQTKREEENVNAMTVELNVHYWKPVPENTEVVIVACPCRKERRHYFVDGAIILPDQSVAATATVHYIMIHDDSATAQREHKRILHAWEPERQTIRF